LQIILLYYSSEDGERDIIPREEELTSLSITRPVSTIIPSFPLKRVRVNVTNVLDSLNLTQWRSKLRDILLPNNSKNMFVSVEQDILPCEEELTSLSITHPVSAIIPSFPLKRVRVNVTNVLDSLNLTQWRSKLRDILLPNNSKNMFVSVEQDILPCEEELTSLSITHPVSAIIPSFPLKRVRVNVTNVLDSLNLTQWRSKLRDILLPNNSKNMFVSVKEKKLIFHWKKNLILQYSLSRKKVPSKL
jgi:predicted transcriptional regulator